jgi:hypothetical protein
MNIHQNAQASLNLARQFLQEDREASRGNSQKAHVSGFQVMTPNQRELTNTLLNTLKELRN